MKGIEERIGLFRGRRAMLDRDLADIYGVPVKRLNEQVRRNRKRFPDDFMFQLTTEEYASFLRSQNATLKSGRGRHRKYRPHVFTEHGAVMLASVLNSARAVQMSLYVVRAFVQLKEWTLTRKEILEKIARLERKYDREFQVVFEALRDLMQPSETPLPRIGFSE